MAEELAVAHMRHLGFADARRTAAGADRGLDVLATGAVAQVKHHAQPVGAPDVQRLRGAAHGVNRPVFYSRNGYTTQAVDFADRADVALFAFDEHNSVTPVNRHAYVLASNQGTGDLGELAALSDANLALIRQVKATHAAIDQAVANELARMAAVRDRLVGGDRSVEVLAGMCRVDVNALVSWMNDRYGPFLEAGGLGEALSATDEMDTAAESGAPPRRDLLEAVAHVQREWRSRQVTLAQELAAILHVDPGDLLA